MEQFVDQLIDAARTFLIFGFNGYYVIAAFVLANLWIVMMLAAFLVVVSIVRREARPRGL